MHMAVSELGCRDYSLSFVIAQNLFTARLFWGGVCRHAVHSALGCARALSKLYSFPRTDTARCAQKAPLYPLLLLWKTLCDGLGKLSALMFERSKLAKITWALATAVPVLGISAAYFLTPSRHILALLLLFLLLTPINFALHRSACEKCGMRRKCAMTMIRGGR